jgi:hypothetical protein
MFGVALSLSDARMVNNIDAELMLSQSLSH